MSLMQRIDEDRGLLSQTFDTQGKASISLVGMGYSIKHISPQDMGNAKIEVAELGIAQRAIFALGVMAAVSQGNGGRYEDTITEPYNIGISTLIPD